MKIIATLTALILWPILLIAYSLRKHTRCAGCKRVLDKENIIFGHCIDCVEAIANETQEVTHTKSDWLVLQNEEYTQRDLGIFLDQQGYMYLEDFSGDEVTLKAVGHDGTSL